MLCQCLSSSIFCPAISLDKGLETYHEQCKFCKFCKSLSLSLSLFVNWQPSRSQLETPTSDLLFKLFLDEDKIIYNNLIYKHNLYIHSYNIVFSLFATDRIEGIQDRSIVSYISTVSVQVSQFRFGFIIDSETWCMGGLPVCDLQTCIISERTFSFLL